LIDIELAAQQFCAQVRVHAIRMSPCSINGNKHEPSRVARSATAVATRAPLAVVFKR